MKLTAIATVPDLDVINVLEGLLAEAKTGKIQSIAYVVSIPNYCTGNGWAGMNKNNMAIIGELMALQHDMVGYFTDLRVKSK